jgi:predicted RNA-binding Zn-ribbon protein involved in translation (DUF1610 family)
MRARSFCASTGQVINSIQTYVRYPCSSCNLPRRRPSYVCSQNSNIVQLFSMLKKDDKSQQVVYYQVRVCAEARFLFM